MFLNTVIVRYYVYFRLPEGQIRTYGTYFVSAFWHGFYPGYYSFFIYAALLTETARQARRVLRPYFIVPSEVLCRSPFSWLTRFSTPDSKPEKGNAALISSFRFSSQFSVRNCVEACVRRFRHHLHSYLYQFWRRRICAAVLGAHVVGAEESELFRLHYGARFFCVFNGDSSAHLWT